MIAGQHSALPLRLHLHLLRDKFHAADLVLCA